MTLQVDVLVVGGGPAGLAVAQTAAPFGRVLVVHQDRAIGLPVRTSGGSWKQPLESLAIPPHLYREIRRLRFATSGEKVDVSFGADCPVVLDVTATYRHLAQLAQSAGAEIRCGTRFLHVQERTSEYVRCAIASGSEESEVCARYVVDASGHHRAVLQAVAVAKRPERFGVGVEYEFQNGGTDSDRAVLFVGERFAPAGYGWIFPTADNRVRVGIGIIRPDTKASPSDLLDRFLHAAEARDLGLDRGELIEKHFGVIPSDGAADSFVHDRIIAVGDAAGQALSLVGEGIRYGIEAGRRAGHAIGEALQQPKNASAALRSYEKWWSAAYRRRFQLAQRANVSMGQFIDEHWLRVASLLRGLSGDEVAALLRMDYRIGSIPKLVLRGGWRMARLAWAAAT